MSVEAEFGCFIIVLCLIEARKPGMTRDDLFKINAGIVKSLCEAVAKTCPEVVTILLLDSNFNVTMSKFIEFNFVW